MSAAQLPDVRSSCVPVVEEVLESRGMTEDEHFATFGARDVSVPQAAGQMNERTNSDFEVVVAAGHRVTASEDVERLIHGYVSMQGRAIPGRGDAAEKSEVTVRLRIPRQKVTADGRDSTSSLGTPMEAS